ncbi:hypothetical protein D3C86_2125430 [compost metagenome]
MPESGSAQQVRSVTRVEAGRVRVTVLLYLMVEKAPAATVMVSWPSTLPFTDI